MKLKEGVDIKGIRNIMRYALGVAERIWTENGRREGVTITSGLEGEHKANSLHPCGLAVDLRTRYFTLERQRGIFNRLQSELKTVDPNYGVELETNHMHVQWKPPKDLEHHY